MGFWRQFVDGTASECIAYVHRLRWLAVRCMKVPAPAGKLAFFPPQPPTYKLQQHTDGGREYYIQPKDP